MTKKERLPTQAHPNLAQSYEQIWIKLDELVNPLVDTLGEQLSYDFSLVLLDFRELFDEVLNNSKPEQRQRLIGVANIAIVSVGNAVRDLVEIQVIRAITRSDAGQLYLTVMQAATLLHAASR